MQGIQYSDLVKVFNCLTALESNVGGNDCTYSIESRVSSRTVSNNGSGSGLAPAQNILAVQVRFGFTSASFSRFRFGSGSPK